MKLRNVLIVVEDIERSRKFYHDLFGLDMVLDNDGNMILTEGLVLQDRKIWEKFPRIPKTKNGWSLLLESQPFRFSIKIIAVLPAHGKAMHRRYPVPDTVRFFRWISQSACGCGWWGQCTSAEP